MTTNFIKLLQKHAENTLYDGPYLAGAFECFLGLAGRTVVADGLNRDTVAFLLISNALGVLNEAVVPYNPAAVRANADRIVAMALSLRKDYDDLDEITREALARKEGQG
jgi:hypothetical protein